MKNRTDFYRLHLSFVSMRAAAEAARIISAGEHEEPAIVAGSETAPFVVGSRVRVVVTVRADASIVRAKKHGRAIAAALGGSYVAIV